MQYFEISDLNTVICVQDWERCEEGIGGSLEKLRAFKRQLSQPLPDNHEELQAEQMRCLVLYTTMQQLLICMRKLVSTSLHQ